MPRGLFGPEVQLVDRLQLAIMDAERSFNIHASQGRPDLARKYWELACRLHHVLDEAVADAANSEAC